MGIVFLSECGFLSAATLFITPFQASVTLHGNCEYTHTLRVVNAHAFSHIALHKGTLAARCRRSDCEYKRELSSTANAQGEKNYIYAFYKFHQFGL